ncbi:hypothetical protein TrLO_g5767 [Triparma laevis f. longispina]|uniref:Ubiquitin thioesterase OTU n=1 Tax=Triparma laevis f. longispina TaxID=1714387 RepID=A0A9W7KUQ1_9STRA|nr:hypothetical protein TrLO_g5767 [Triparma laevis f. longispina]
MVKITEITTPASASGSASSAIRTLRTSSTLHLSLSLQKIASKSIKVSLQGWPAKPQFSLGGKHGNIVVKSRDKRIHKGWRVFKVDGARVGRGEVRGVVEGKYVERRKGGGRKGVGYEVEFFIGEEQEEEEEEEEERKGEEGVEEERRNAEAEAAAAALKLKEEEEAAAAAAAVQKKLLEEEIRLKGEWEKADAAVAEKLIAEEEARRLKENVEKRAEAAAAAKKIRVKEDAARQKKELEASKKLEEETRRRKLEEERKVLTKIRQETADASKIATKLAQASKLTGLPSRSTIIEPQKALLSALTLPPKSPEKSTPPCDKCDGPHSTSSCPYFKGKRDNHNDAWVKYGKKGEESDSCISNSERKYRGTVIHQPGDGSCLFHSLSYSISGENATSLRSSISEYIKKNPTKEIAGTAIKEWVFWDCSMDCEAYADSMITGSKWGGAIEIAVCAHVTKKDVLVYEKKGKGFECISKFVGGGEGEIRLCYSGRCHYDALK